MQCIEFKPRWGHSLKLQQLLPLGDSNPSEKVFKCISDFEADIIRDYKSRLPISVHFIGGFKFSINERYPQVNNAILKEICIGRSDADSYTILIFEE